MQQSLRHCRSLVISEHNLKLIGSRYSYKDYDEFYEHVFLPIPISNEELLNIPTYIGNENDGEETDDATQSTEPEDDDDFDLW
jgi:hypothetical protein